MKFKCKYLLLIFCIYCIIGMFINEVSLNFISDSSSVLVINWVMIWVNKDVNEKLKFKGSYLVVKNILFILFII